MVMLETLKKQIADGTYTMTNKTLTNPVINYTDTTIGTNVKCRAYLGTAQNNIAANTNVTITLQTENYDVGSDFNTGTYRFVAPVNGYYAVSACVGFSTIADQKTYQAILNYNGTDGAYSMVSSSGTGPIRLQISDITYLTAGQYIELQGRTNDTSGAVDFIAASASTYMAVHLLSI